MAVLLKLLTLALLATSATVDGSTIRLYRQIGCSATATYYQFDNVRTNSCCGAPKGFVHSAGFFDTPNNIVGLFGPTKKSKCGHTLSDSKPKLRNFCYSLKHKFTGAGIYPHSAGHNRGGERIREQGFQCKGSVAPDKAVLAGRMFNLTTMPPELADELEDLMADDATAKVVSQDFDAYEIPYDADET